MNCLPTSGEVLSVAILVCTRGRPEALTACLEGISKAVCPPGTRLSVVVGDNNDVSQKEMIVSLAGRLGLPIIHVWEGQRGYCYVRNALLDAADKLRSDILIFIDDDHRAEPGLVSAYVDRFERYDADVVHGSYLGSSREYPEGRRAKKVATYNVAFKRRLIAPTSEGGLGLRFDTRLNLTGREDIEFFRDAGKAGAHMIYSSQPLTRPTSDQGADAASRSLTAYAAARNAVYVERLRHGWHSAVIFFLKFYVGRPAFWRGAFDGLMLGGVDRCAAKNGNIIPITARS